MCENESGARGVSSFKAESSGLLQAASGVAPAVKGALEGPVEAVSATLVLQDGNS